MGQKPTETGPIVEESTPLKHIGYALDLVSKLLDMEGFPEDYDGERDHWRDLVNLQHHLVNAKYAIRPTPTVESVAAILEDLYAVKIDEDDPTLVAREIATENAFLILEDIPHGDPWKSWSPSCDCDCHSPNWPSSTGEHGPCWCMCEEPSDKIDEDEDESTVEKLYILVQDIADEDWYDSDKHQEALQLIESMMGAWE